MDRYLNCHLLRLFFFRPRFQFIIVPGVFLLMFNFSSLFLLVGILLVLHRNSFVVNPFPSSFSSEKRFGIRPIFCLVELPLYHRGTSFPVLVFTTIVANPFSSGVYSPVQTESLQFSSSPCRVSFTSDAPGVVWWIPLGHWSSSSVSRPEPLPPPNPLSLITSFLSSRGRPTVSRKVVMSRLKRETYSSKRYIVIRKLFSIVFYGIFVVTRIRGVLLTDFYKFE